MERESLTPQSKFVVAETILKRAEAFGVKHRNLLIDRAIVNFKEKDSCSSDTFRFVIGTHSEVVNVRKQADSNRFWITPPRRP
jgi:hypothetical protein